MTVNVTPTPFASHGLVFINSGYPGASPRPVYAIRPGASGDISLKGDQTSNEFVVWYQPLLGTYNTSSLVYGDLYYTLLDRGFLLCHDVKTGRQVYGRQRISAEAAGFTASPWGYNGKIFLLSEDGDTFVVEAGREFKLRRQELLERDGARHAGGRPQQPDHPDAIEAVSDRPKAAAGESLRSRPRQSEPVGEQAPRD